MQFLSLQMENSVFSFRLVLNLEATLYISSKAHYSEALTLAVPHRLDDMVLHAEDDSSQDDCSKRGFRNECTVGHEEGQTEDDQSPSVDTTKRCLHSTCRVHCCTGERSSCRHSLHKRPNYVTEPKSNHFLAGIYWFATG